MVPAGPFFVLKDVRAQGLVEYSLVIAFIAIVCVAALRFFGSREINEYNTITSSVNNAIGP